MYGVIDVVYGMITTTVWDDYYCIWHAHYCACHTVCDIDGKTRGCRREGHPSEAQALRNYKERRLIKSVSRTGTPFSSPPAQTPRKTHKHPQCWSSSAAAHRTRCVHHARDVIPPPTALNHNPRSACSTASARRPKSRAASPSTRRCSPKTARRPGPRCGSTRRASRPRRCRNGLRTTRKCRGLRTARRKSCSILLR